ncbi:unnamed protein product [Urochloa humidicola]
MECNSWGGRAGAERLHRSRVLKKLLKEQKQAGRIYSGVWSSLNILQQQGLLEGRFEIISLSGSFLLAEDGDTRSRLWWSSGCI